MVEAKRSPQGPDMEQQSEGATGSPEEKGIFRFISYTDHDSTIIIGRCGYVVWSKATRSKSEGRGFEGIVGRTT